MLQQTGNSSHRSKKMQGTTDFLVEYGKLPPQVIELEQAVLGALMLERDALTAVIDILKKEYFYKESHQRIYEAIMNLFGRSEPVDILTVANELKSMRVFQEVGGGEYLAELTSRVASSANIEYHAGIIMQKYIQRELIRVSSMIIKEAYDDSIDIFDLLDSAEKQLYNITESNLQKTYVTMESALVEALERIKAAGKEKDNITGVPSGYVDLDRLTGGWQKSELIVLAARPGMGKTAFVLSMARNMAVDYNKPIAIFSLEMDVTQLVMRLISSETEIAAEKLKRGRLNAEEWVQLLDRIKNLEKAPIYIDDTSAISVFELRAKCRRLKAQYDIQLVIVDYLQLMTASVDTRGNREQEISSISRALKSLAKELHIPVIAISQLSRAVEKRTKEDKRPMLSDLRESGAIEQDADMVLFIYRPEYYKDSTEEIYEKGLTELIVAKNRHGEQKTINLRFIDSLVKFVDINEDYGDGSISISSNNEFDNKKMKRVIKKQSKMNDENLENNNDNVPF